jgi:hypothetical protein
MTLGTKTELARHWKLDARNSIFKKIKPAAYQSAGGKRIPLYAIDPDLTPVKILDFNRVNRAAEILRPSMIRKLAKMHGENWFAEVAKLLK